MSLLTCLGGNCQWWDQSATLARHRVARAFQKAGVEFVKSLGHGAQSWACHIRYEGQDYCLKLSHVDDHNHFGTWDETWGTRPFDVPILMQADFYIQLESDGWNEDHCYYHFKAIFQPIGVHSDYTQSCQAETYWCNQGYRMVDPGSKQWVIINGRTLLTDYGSIKPIDQSPLPEYSHSSRPF